MLYLKAPGENYLPADSIPSALTTFLEIHLSLPKLYPRNPLIRGNSLSIIE